MLVFRQKQPLSLDFLVHRASRAKSGLLRREAPRNDGERKDCVIGIMLALLLIYYQLFPFDIVIWCRCCEIMFSEALTISVHRQYSRVFDDEGADSLGSNGRSPDVDRRRIDSICAAAPEESGMPADAASPFIAIEGLSKSFSGIRVLKDVSFDVGPAKSTRCSERTAPASRPSSRRSRAFTSRTAAVSRSTASP